MAAISPFVHGNGSSKQHLLALRERAYLKLGEAIEALEHMGPNGRDYYLVSGLLERAIENHAGRMAAVFGVMDELSEECRLINEQT